MTGTDARRRDILHDWLDGILSELGPGENPFSLGLGVSCGRERLLCYVVDGDTAVRKAVLTDGAAVAAAFTAGSVDVASEDVPS